MHKITKAGKRDLRVAANTHPHWKAELARLEPRLGCNKAIVAIARKLLICVWHILSRKVDSVWEQEKLEARKLLEICAESPASGSIMKSGHGRSIVRRS